MQIKIFKDLREYTLTSTIKAEDIIFAKKYCPKALKIQDDEGNDIFAMSYNENHNSVSAVGVTFGGKTADDGYAIVCGKLPGDVKLEDAGEYVADMVGAALENINTIEKTLPAVLTDVKAQRKALIDGIASV